MIKHMGTNRTRGFGEISVTIMDEKIFKSFEISSFLSKVPYNINLSISSISL